MQRVLVLGGAGLVGSHLVDRLIADGHEVIAIDDLSRGSYANVAHLRRERRFVFLEHDAVTPFRAKVDRIFYLALPSSRSACGTDPVKAAMTCVAGTKNALEVAASRGARMVLGPASERWGAGVRCAEALAVDFARARGVDLRIVRLPSTYGPRLAPDGDHLVTELALQALRGERLAPRGRLDRRVQLTYVDDAVETLVQAMNADSGVTSVVAPSSEPTVLDVALTIAEAAGLAGAELAEPIVDGPPSSTSWLTAPTLMDALPATNVLPMRAPVELTEGIARTLRWFEARTARRPADRPSGIYACDKAAPTPALARDKMRAG